MILLVAIPAAFIAATLIAGFLYEHTVLGNHVDRWLAGPPAEPALVYELADLLEVDFDLEWQSFGADL